MCIPKCLGNAIVSAYHVAGFGAGNDRLTELFIETQKGSDLCSVDWNISVLYHLVWFTLCELLFIFSSLNASGDISCYYFGVLLYHTSYRVSMTLIAFEFAQAQVPEQEAAIRERTDHFVFVIANEVCNVCIGQFFLIDFCELLTV